MRRFALGLILILLTLTFVVIVFSKHVALKLVVTQPLEAQAMSSGTSMDSMIVRADRLMNVLPQMSGE